MARDLLMSAAIPSLIMRIDSQADKQRASTICSLKLPYRFLYRRFAIVKNMIYNNNRKNKRFIGINRELIIDF
jgi:hypothetical protein